MKCNAKLHPNYFSVNVSAIAVVFRGLMYKTTVLGEIVTVTVNPEDIFDYFENIVCLVRANNLHTYSIGLALRYSSKIFDEHSKEYRCCCFKCRIHQLLAETRISRGYYLYFWSM